jgi:hypothetical protein
MKEKVKILCYECKKCNKRVYFRSNEEYTTQCKTCKNEMQFICENRYNPKNGLSAIKLVILIIAVKVKTKTIFLDVLLATVLM